MDRGNSEKRLAAILMTDIVDYSHLMGDATFQDDDIYGDGINIAARPEALAESGHVRVSKTVQQSRLF